MGNIRKAKGRIRESRGGIFGLFRRSDDGKELNLSRLSLTSEDLVQLIPIIKRNLPNLELLNLRENRLISLPEGIGNLTNLKVLGLSRNGLTSLPEGIGNLTNLTRLNLGSNALTSLPESIGNLVNLVNLDLNENHLTSLPHSIRNLTNLTRLYISYNAFTSLPNSVGSLPNLKVLYVRDNALTSVHDSIENLINLTDLILAGNELTSIPEGIGNLGNLTDLNLRKNRLTTIPDSLVNLTNLTRLNLGHNPWFLKVLLDISVIDILQVTLPVITLDKANKDTFELIFNDFEFRNVAMSVANTYPNTSADAFNSLFLCLSADQKHGILKFDLPLRALGIGPDSTNNLSNECAIDIPLSSLFDMMNRIKATTGMSSKVAFDLLKTKPWYLQGILEFGLREDQMEQIDSQKMRALLYRTISEKIKEIYYSQDDQEMVLSQLTDDDKDLARVTFDEVIQEYKSQQTSTKNSIEKELG